MAVQPTYPGVYIEEFAPSAPIQGVSTNIVAFIGTAIKGDLDTPTKLNSWDLFKEQFGEAPAPGSMLWHAVRGFFENGGQTCYIVRASNGDYARETLDNRAGNDVVRVKAKQPGSTNPVSVSVAATSVLQGANTTVFRPAGNTTAVTGRTATLTDEFEAAQFRPGDWLDFSGTRAQALRVSGANLTLDRELAGAAAQPGAVRLANLSQGDQTLRIQSTNPLQAETLVQGSILTIAQNGTTDTQVVQSVQAEYFKTGPNPADTATTYRVTFQQGLDVPINMDPTSPAVSVSSEEITFTVTSNGTAKEYQNLGLDPDHLNYYVDFINDNDQSVRLERVEPPPPDSLPASLPDDVSVQLQGGQDENLATLGDNDYFEAIDTLREIDEVSIVAIPGVYSEPVQQYLIAHCELLADRFAVLDAKPGAGLFGAGSVEEHRKQLDSTRGYAALYYPWLKATSALTGREILVPPSGHVCGVIARVDQRRGVHKAPANEIVNGAVGVEKTMSDQEQGLLNLQGINVIRSFKDSPRPRVWGARTTATDLNWQYINVRRLFLYIEESIQEGIRSSVFEPNNPQLWQNLKRTITEFLARVWRDGGLFGLTADEAFYVRIDEALNPFSEQQLGRLHIEIGVRPTYPAEFIIVRIGIWPGGSEISEG